MENMRELAWWIKDQTRKCLDVYIKEFNLERNNIKLNFTQQNDTDLNFKVNSSRNRENRL